MNELPEVVRKEIRKWAFSRIPCQEAERIALLALQQGREQGLEEAAKVCDAQRMEAESDYEKEGPGNEDFLAEAGMAAMCAAAIRAVKP